MATTGEKFLKIYRVSAMYLSEKTQSLLLRYFSSLFPLSLYGPKCDNVTLSHSLQGQLYGPNRDQKLFKNSYMVKTLFKKVQIQNVTMSHSLLGQLYGPNRDSVTLSHSL